MPVLGALRSWVLMAAGVPLVAVDPVICTEMPVADVWSAVAVPPDMVTVLVAVARVVDGFTMVREEVPVAAVLCASPRYTAAMSAVVLDGAVSV
jgi:hypothetical protein